MNRVRSSRDGYTIVETMIFLAVSGALFLSAMIVINGKQRKTEFNTTVRDFDSKLQSIIGNVSSGYYNSPGNVSCVVSGGIPVVSNTPSVQGQNQACTYIGQYIDLVAPFDKFTITSYAGLRRDPITGKDITSLAAANATPITSTAEDYNLLSGVTASMKLVGPGTNIVKLAVTTTFNQNTTSGILKSGSSRTELHAITAANVDNLNPLNGVQICLNGGDQVGIIVLNTGTTTVSIGSSCP